MAQCKCLIIIFKPASSSTNPQTEDIEDKMPCYRREDRPMPL